MSNNRKRLIIISIIVIVLIAGAIGAAYAFHVLNIASGSSTGTNVTAGTRDSLTFSSGDGIYLVASEENFDEGDGNLFASTTVSATLTANNHATSAISYDYAVSFVIDENTFVKTTSNAELILSGIDPNGNAIYLGGGANLVTVNGVTGYDITGKTGTFVVSGMTHTISTQTSKTDTWAFTITFINLDTDQEANDGAYIKAYAKISRVGNYASDTLLADQACTSGMNLSDCIKNTYTSNGQNGLYYHTPSLANSAGDYSYRFSGPNPSNYVCFNQVTGACAADHLYRIIGVIPTKLSDGTTKDLVKLIKLDYATTENLGSTGNFASTSVSSAASLYNPENVAAISHGRFYWNYANNEIVNGVPLKNIWRLSLLNTNNLNNYFLNSYLNSTWRNKIANVEWQVAGNAETALLGFNATTGRYEGTARTFYENEILSPDDGSSGNDEYIFTAKIGLMYGSDYYYAHRSWIRNTSSSYSSSDIQYNWMYRGANEWTITRCSSSNYDSDGYVMELYTNGFITCNGISASTAVRPVFYLNSDVTYQSGSGTYSDPIRIS